jgi:hypothetical protein
VSEELLEVITKLVLGVIEPEGAERVPGVPPRVFALKKMIELAVTAVVLTVIVPAVIAAVIPIASEAAVEACISSLFPV